jgi:hypothetical protein
MARSSTPLLAVVGLVGAALWYATRNKASAASTPVFPNASSGLNIAPPAPVPASFAPTGSQVTATSAIWANLTPTTGPNTGYVNLPTGSQPAAAFLPWATDGAGNYYTQWAGQIYIVGVGYTDPSGNYTAKLLGT